MFKTSTAHIISTIYIYLIIIYLHLFLLYFTGNKLLLPPPVFLLVSHVKGKVGNVDHRANESWLSFHVPFIITKDE